MDTLPFSLSGPLILVFIFSVSLMVLETNIENFGPKILLHTQSARKYFSIHNQKRLWCIKSFAEKISLLACLVVRSIQVLVHKMYHSLLIWTLQV